VIADQRPTVAETLQISDRHVRTRQLLLLPVPPGRVVEVTAWLKELDAATLIEQYAAFIEHWTHRLIHAERQGELLTLSLTPGGPRLLRLRLEDRATGSPASVVARLTITGGLAAVPSVQEGVLELRLAVRDREQAGAMLEAEVLIDDYAPLLLALPLPRGTRVRLYRATQARLHRAITGAFLRAIVRRTLRS
jgi:hypothetical protein